MRKDDWDQRCEIYSEAVVKLFYEQWERAITLLKEAGINKQRTLRIVAHYINLQTEEQRALFRHSMNDWQASELLGKHHLPGLDDLPTTQQCSKLTRRIRLRTTKR